METASLAENAPLVEAASGTPTSRRFRARLIEGDVWGSSGYYSREVLERDGPNAWPEGTQVFLDHPGEAEMYDRPERSVRDLAGKIGTAPAYESDGLYADVEIYPHVAPVVEAMAEDIGLSIRAAAEVSEGEVDGHRGRIIDRITEGVSVDLVTRAGAGGKLVSLLESARRQVEEAVSDTAWSSFPQSDYTPAQWRRACLIDTGKGAEDSKDRYKLPVREPSGAVNRNGVHAAAGAHGVTAVQGVSADVKKTAARKLVSLYRNQLGEDPPDSLLTAAGMSTSESLALTREAAVTRIREARNVAQWIESRLHLTLTQLADEMFGDGKLTREERIALSGAVGDGLDAFTAKLEDAAPQLYSRDLWSDPDARVAAAEANVPVHPAGQSTITQESEEDTTMPQIEEARLRQLEADAGRVQALEAERDTARTALADTTEQLAVERARDYARDYGTRRVREANADLPAPVVERIVAEAMRDIPMTDGDEGQRRLDTDAFNTRVDEARDAEETYLAGISETTGRVRGLGGDSDKQVTESDVDNIIAGAFGRQVKGA